MSELVKERDSSSRGASRMGSSPILRIFLLRRIPVETHSLGMQMGACTSSTAAVPPQPAPRRVQRKRRIPKTLKRAVWDTYVGVDKGTAPCLCCERTPIRQLEFHCGHVISEARGGTTTVDNMRPICAQCNLSMGTQNLFEFKAKYFPSSETKSKRTKADA